MVERPVSNFYVLVGGIGRVDCNFDSLAEAKDASPEVATEEGHSFTARYSSEAKTVR